MNFPMPLHHKHCKDGATAITRILTHLPFNPILRGLKFKIEKIRGLYAKFGNCKDQIEKWSISVPNSVVSTMHSFFFFFLWHCKPTCKEEQKCEMKASQSY